MRCSETALSFNVFWGLCPPSAVQVYQRAPRVVMASAPRHDQQHSSKQCSAVLQFVFEAAFSHCSLACTGSSPSPGSTPLNAATIRSVRDARAAGGNKFVWLTPVAVPLILSFAFIGVITYHQVLRAAESTRQSRPYGLLGPTINVFLVDEEHKSVEKNVKGASIR
jgi:hypothetical protein